MCILDSECWDNKDDLEMNKTQPYVHKILGWNEEKCTQTVLLADNRSNQYNDRDTNYTYIKGSELSIFLTLVLQQQQQQINFINNNT